MRILLLSFLLFGLSVAYGQFTIGPQGVQQIFGAVTSVGREVVRAAENKKEQQEQERREEEYNNMLAQADALFASGQYREALDSYNTALRIKQEQYVRDQIARCNAEIARAERQEYQLLIDKADSLYARENYPAAIETYTAALERSNQQYAREKIAQVKADQERLQKVQFSGLLISDRRVDDLSSKAYSKDPYSDFIKPGKYTIIEDVLVYSSYQTLDGIAVPANMRLVIYSEPHFKGEVLLDINGPAIINNVSKKSVPVSAEAHERDFTAPLQDKFPRSVRTWSMNDMKAWINGSMEILVIP
ncbi:Tetratricopeptide repeat protein [compost metagenome]